MQKSSGSIHWFRKGLRLHDNPALLEACKSQKLYPIFCLDPHFAKPDIVGVNRYSFLLESLADLDDSLRKLGSRLYVVKGNPEEIIIKLVKEWNIDLLTFESDTEPYALKRDKQLMKLLEDAGVKVSKHSTHTLFDPEQYIAKSKGNPPNTYTSFCKLFDSLGKVRQPVEAPESHEVPKSDSKDLQSKDYHVPTLREMGYEQESTTTFRGGESEALKRLERKVLLQPSWVASFEKPMTSPNSLEPSTTVLSPYLKFGCLSPAKFYHALADIYKKSSSYSKPPVSLHGQLLWREFFYLSSCATPNFDKMVGNKQCKQIPWERDEEMIRAFKEARTGFPYIDAIMTQLKTEGWIHHLARHSVACFLTRGDLWQHWEEGAKIFDLYLLDADWALNNANWQWLSCSNFFYQYFRCYSPVAFGKKTDPDGDYIKKWLPQLAKFPKKYIYEPWTAPLNIQQSSGCVIGRDYPRPIVDHQIASKANMEKMKDAYAHQDLMREELSGSKSGSSKRKTDSAESSAPKKSKL